VESLSTEELARLIVSFYNPRWYDENDYSGVVGIFIGGSNSGPWVKMNGSIIDESTALRPDRLLMPPGSIPKNIVNLLIRSGTLSPAQHYLLYRKLIMKVSKEALKHLAINALDGKSGRYIESVPTSIWSAMKPKVMAAARKRSVPNLSTMAAAALVKQGVTSENLKELGYPTDIIQIVNRTAGSKRKAHQAGPSRSMQPRPSKRSTSLAANN